MTYQEALEQARTCIGKCRACPVCNGLACKNMVPGPGAKGLGTGAIRNYQKWQELCVNMDTICENGDADTSYDFFGKKLTIPVMAGPVGAVTLHCRTAGCCPAVWYVWAQAFGRCFCRRTGGDGWCCVWLARRWLWDGTGCICGRSAHRWKRWLAAARR